MTHIEEPPVYETPHPCARCLEKRRRRARALTAASEESQKSYSQESGSEHTYTIRRPEPCLAGPSGCRNSRYGDCDDDGDLISPRVLTECTSFGMGSKDIPLGTIFRHTEFNKTAMSFPESTFSTTSSVKGKDKAVPVDCDKSTKSSKTGAGSYSSHHRNPDDNEGREMDVLEMLRSG